MLLATGRMAPRSGVQPSLACTPALLTPAVICHPAPPVWRPPRSKSVLRSLPFMAALPSHYFEAILRQGEIKGG